MAENVAESLVRGSRAIVTGRLRQRSYETKEGEKRTVYELEADEIGVSLRNATAKVWRVQRRAAVLAASGAKRRPFGIAPGGRRAVHALPTRGS